jgi:IS30 family transposase
MENPFIITGYIKPEYFCDREKEAESLNRALDEMEAHKKNGTKPMSFDDFMAKLDKRPRKKLNFSTPKECFYKNIS